MYNKLYISKVSSVIMLSAVFWYNRVSISICFHLLKKYIIINLYIISS